MGRSNFAELPEATAKRRQLLDRPALPQAWALARSAARVASCLKSVRKDRPIRPLPGGGRLRHVDATIIADMVDAIFEGNHDAHGWMVMTANLKGRECINALFPRARIAWRDPGGSTDRGAARGPPDTCQARAGRVLPTPSSLQAWRGETTSGSSWSPTVRPVISGRIVDMRVLRKMNVAEHAECRRTYK